MEKKYLGLGIVFNALDKGLSSAVKGVTSALNKARDAMTGVEESAEGKGKKGGIFNKMVEGAKLLTLSKIGSTISDINNTLNGTSSGINHTALQLDFLQAKMIAALDPGVADDFNKQLIPLIRNFGLTGDQVETVANNFVNAGGSLNELEKTLPMVGTLVGKLGMDAEHVSGMFGKMTSAFGASADSSSDLVKSIFKIQKQFKLTNLMAPLPEIVDNVYKNSIRFGKINSVNALSTVKDITKMAAAFQKVGFSQQQAVSMSTNFADKVADIRESFMKLQVGMDPGPMINQFSDALGAGGLDVAKFLDQIRSGASPAKVFEDLGNAINDLPTPEKKMSVILRLKDAGFGDELSAAMGDTFKQIMGVNKAAEKEGEKIGSANKAFQELDKTLTSTLDFQQKLHSANEELLNIMKDIANKNDYIKALHAQTLEFQFMTDAVNDLNNPLGETLKFFRGLETIGLGFLFPGFAGAAVYTKILTGMIFPLTSLLGIFTLFSGPISAVWGVITGAFSGLLGVASKVVGVFSKLTGVGKIWQKVLLEVWYHTTLLKESILKIGESLGGKLFGFIAKILPRAFGLLGGSILRIATGPIGIFLTALSLIVEFFPQIVKAVSFFSKDAGVALQRFGDFVGGIWDGIKNKAQSVWDGIADYISDKWSTVMNAFSVDSAMGTISKIFGKLKDAWDGFVSVLPSPVQGVIQMVERLVNSLVNGFKQAFTSLEVFVANLMAGIANKLPDSIKNMMSGEGMLGKLFSSKTAANPQAAKDTANLAGAMVDKLNSATVPEQKLSVALPASALPTVAVAQTKMNQPGAPVSAPIGGRDLAPVAAPEFESTDISSLYKVMSETKDTLASLLEKLIDKPVNVILQGDAKKMFSQMSKQAAERAGVLGLNHAVSR